MIDTLRVCFHAAGVHGVIAAIAGKLTGTSFLVQTHRSGIRHPFFLRLPSSDAWTLEQIFVQQEYRFDVARQPVSILDAGANIGLASILLANRFPRARIIAIEPEAGNFALLERNVAPYPNITPIRAALWHDNSTVDIVDPGLGHWGFMVRSGMRKPVPGDESVTEVPAITVDAIMQKYGLERIDILKMDIEGAEYEVFDDPSRWISKVGALIVELHDRTRPGCSRRFYSRSSGFDHEWQVGENVYLSRSGSCVAPAAVSADTAVSEAHHTVCA